MSIAAVSHHGQMTILASIAIFDGAKLFRVENAISFQRACLFFTQLASSLKQREK
jgi:hypothetical protein